MVAREESRRRWPHRWHQLAGGLFLALGILSPLSAPASGSGADPAVPGTVTRVLPIDVELPSGLTWDGENFWVSDLLTSTLCRISPGGEVLDRKEAPGTSPHGLAWDGERLWCLDASSKRACALDPDSWTTVASLEVETEDPRCIAWDSGALWVSGGRGERLERLAVEDGTTLRWIPGPTAGPGRRSDVCGIAAEGGRLWVSDRLADALFQVDAASGEVLNIFPSPGPYPTGVAWDGSRLWCLDYERRTLFALAPLGGAPYATYEPKGESLRFTESWVNRGPGTLATLDIYMAVPSDQPNQKLLGPPSFDPKPAEFLVDPWGQPVARFRFRDVKPGTTVGATMKVAAELSKVRWFLEPEVAGELGDVPPDIAERYLRDEPKLGVGSPEVRSAVREAVGGERNAYWVAHRIYRFVQEKLRYELKGGWSAAPEVLRRGTGSCSEYTFVMLALCRAAGLPARYQGSVVIRGDDASRDEVFHRWVEVYLPNYGWIPVDPSGGDSEVPEDRAKFFGGLDNRYLITTVGGGASPYLGWDYNSRAVWTARGAVSLEPRKYGDWAPLAKAYAPRAPTSAGGADCKP